MLKLTLQARVPGQVNTVDHAAPGLIAGIRPLFIPLDKIVSNFGGMEDEPARIYGDTIVFETPKQITRMIALFRQAEFDAKVSRSVEATLARREHGLAAVPLYDFPAYVALDEDGEAQVYYA